MTRLLRSDGTGELVKEEELLLTPDGMSPTEACLLRWIRAVIELFDAKAQVEPYKLRLREKERQLVRLGCPGRQRGVVEVKCTKNKSFYRQKWRDRPFRVAFGGVGVTVYRACAQL